MTTRTLLWVNRFLGRYGGAEENILVTAKKLKEKYHSHFLYSESCVDGELLFQDVFEKKFNVPFEDDEKNAEQTVQILKETSPDLIFVHNCDSVAMMNTFLESGIPVVRMNHDHEVYCLRGNKYFPLLGLRCPFKGSMCCLFPGLAFLKRNAKDGRLCWNNIDYSYRRRRLALDQKCDLIITNSHYMKKELAHQGYDPKRIEVVHPPTRIDIDLQFRSNFSNHNIILFVGQVIRGKGLDVLLKALTYIEHPYRLVVLGKGNDLPYCRKLAQKLGISSKVDFEGWVPAEEMDHYYRQATLGVVPSVWLEPFGAVGVEMMQHGLPVVAFDTGGISDWLQDGKTGFLVPWKDTKKLAQKIDLLLTNKEKSKELGKRGREFALEMFNTERLVARLDQLFEKIISVGVSR